MMSNVAVRYDVSLLIFHSHPLRRPLPARASRIARCVTAAAVSILVVAGWAPVAGAHTGFESSDPAEGAALDVDPVVVRSRQGSVASVQTFVDSDVPKSSPQIFHDVIETAAELGAVVHGRTPHVNSAAWDNLDLQVPAAFVPLELQPALWRRRHRRGNGVVCQHPDDARNGGLECRTLDLRPPWLARGIPQRTVKCVNQWLQPKGRLL